ncbi:MAG: hypothetical protein OEZ29_08545, partial [Candidatus Bathyarchaeota archaeon]|nr:hypothetical protein [Candidatus Bathyarchaeota archaeon]
MLDFNGKKPRTGQEFVRLLTAAKEKEREMKKASKSRSTKPTISGTAKIMKIHRDTLYEWMKEFAVNFEDVGERKPTFVEAVERRGKPTYLIGEALMGEGSEVAHV